MIMFPSINRSLLPIKAHYFLYVAAQACVLPYLAAVGRSNGIPGSSIAYIFAFIPFAAIFLKFVCGYIADKTQNVTGILLVLVLSLLVSNGMVFFSKSVQDHTRPPLSRLVCPLSNFTLISPFANCTQLAPPCDLDSCDRNVSTETDVVLYGNVSAANSETLCSLLQPNDTTVLRAFPFEVCLLYCSCFESEFNAVNYGVYVVFVAISFMAGASVFVLSDAAVCEKLGDKANSFGKQRIWGTISWGILSPIAGIAIDAANAATNGRARYAPGFYIFAALIVMDMVVLHFTPRLRMGAQSLSFFKDIRTVFGGCEFIVFAVWTCFTGVFFGVQAAYSAWFLEDIGAPKLVIGLGFAIMTLLAELPILFLADKILVRIGYFSSYCLSFASSAIKLIAYSFLRNPWHALFIDVIGGAAFPLALASMTVFARENALQGTSASVLCALNACFEGIGVVVGNFIGGVSFEKIGGRLTYQYLAIAATICMVGCGLSGFIVRKLHPKDSLWNDTVNESNGA